MLAACAGYALWAYPILSHVEAMAKSKKWTSENCAVYTNMFLNSNYEPNRRIWGLPSKSNIKETSCDILFASSVPNKNKVERNEYDSQLWLGNCKRTIKHGDSNDNTQNSGSVVCYGSGARYA
ncbi:hypothetical protein MKW92_011001 [Papaver armeniacum]|nr:hypothetical protein MKW92_011001 [Papaver armeniacum]